MTDQIEIQTENPPTLKLTFDRADDRWNHRWIGESAAAPFEIMTSVEGTPDQAWPSSPPLQDVSLHPLEQGLAILCVGMAGKSHWSASYSVETEAESTLIQADLACLQKEISTTAVLGSSYKLNPNCQVKSASQECVELSSPAGIITLDTIQDAKIEAVFELAEAILTVKPVHPSENTKVATRWGFQIKIVSP